MRKFALAVTAVALVAGVAACDPEAVPVAGESQKPASVGPAATVTSKPASTAKPTPAKSTTPSIAPTKSTDVTTFRATVPALPKLVSIKDMGPIQQNDRVAGRDNGQSALYGGKSVWIFDDTTFKNPWGFVSNTAAATTDLDASNGIDLRSSNGVTIDNAATPPELIPRTAAEKAFEKAHAAPAGGCKGSKDQYCGAIFGFWPGMVIADSARHRVIFSYGKLCRGGQDGTPCSGSLGKGLGQGFAALDMNSGVVTRLTSNTAVGSVEGPDSTIFFGPGDKAAAGSGAGLVVGDDAYLYGQCDYFDCAMAKVPLAQFTDKSAWRYYDGSTFQADSGKAKKTGAQPGAAGNTVFYSPALKAYVDVYMPYGSNEIWFRVGGAPYGPWSAGTKLMKTTGDTAHPNYALFGHAEFAQKDGLTQYLSYFDGSTGAQHLVRWDMSAN